MKEYKQERKKETRNIEVRKKYGRKKVKYVRMNIETKERNGGYKEIK